MYFSYGFLYPNFVHFRLSLVGLISCRVHEYYFSCVFLLASPRSVNMRKENMINANVQELPGRLTRSRATALLGSRQMRPLKAVIQQNKKRALQTNPKKVYAENNSANVDNAGLQRKRRMVLQDVTNVCCENSYKSCLNATKIQVNTRIDRLSGFTDV